MNRHRRADRYMISAPALMELLKTMTEGVCEEDRQALFCIVQGAVDELIAENVIKQRTEREQLRPWQKKIIAAGVPAHLLNGEEF